VTDPQPAAGSATAPVRDARSARVAVSVLFLVNGALYANVVPRLPAIKADLGLSNSALGAALAFSPVGALVSGSLAGLLVARVGSGRLAAGCGAVFGAVLALVALAPAWPALAAAMLLIGALDSVMDVAMNTHGLRVQRGYGRSIINAFHAWWSIGAVVGGVAGTAAASADVPLGVHLLLAGAVLGAAAAATLRWLLAGPDPAAGAEPGDPGDLPQAPDPAESSHRAVHPDPAGGPHGGRALLGLGGLGAFALLAAAVEDVPASWGAVYLRDGLGTSASVAGLGFVAFTAGMTAGRLVNDRLVDRWGSAAVVRAGSLSGGLVLAVALAIGAPAAALVAFAAMGLGASSAYPLMFAAAASRPDVRPGDGIALVSWLGRVGFLVAPPLVGVLADGFSLAVGVAVGVVASLGVAALARTLRPGPRRPDGRGGSAVPGRRFGSSRGC